ncbi:hypothetical protein EHV15_29340 [Paenibacillus oralis]|uniref:Lipoprotein n=1 Tax=Paenibacillus oralis TaxID=2490856 RepID=A0A3P3U890_9BACL|nr:hypothetical protein [Paenibacillus oralis]RRJ66572.1 hypothetical protein EHV15_29340 [Paenibacillus oralis]
MLKKARGYRKLIWIILLAAVLSACGEPKTGDQWFDFTWSGLAGWDGLTFRGLASLQRGEHNMPEESISYTGQLNNHRELSIRAKSAAQGDKNRFRAAGLTAASGYEAKLRLQNGSWLLQADQSNALLHGMNRLNPLDQLEDIRFAVKKKITLESGAARGTKVLRIEMDPAEAGIRLKDELMAEMSLLGTDLDSKLAAVSPSRRNQVRARLSSILSAGHEQLLGMLEDMEANVLYHLTINRKTGLPSRLTSETKLKYLTPQGQPQQEVLRTDNRFENYK